MATVPSTLPLLAERADLDAPLAWRTGRPISARRYLADVAQVATLVGPPGAGAGPVVNLCLDRYAFAVALGAALSLGRTSLLPPNARADTVAQLRQRWPDPLLLTDDAALDLPGIVRLPPLPGEGDASAATVHEVDAESPLLCLLTSGSTGVPQPHTKTWAQEQVNTDAGAARLAEHLGLPDLHGITIVATVPPQHSYGIESSVLLALQGGAAFEAGRPFYPADIADALAAVPRPRALVTTPFHLKALLGAGLALPAVDVVLSATAPLSPQLARECERQLGGPLVEVYGCTEAGQVATRRTAAGEVWQTYGALRVHAEPLPAGAEADERFIVTGGHVLEPTPLADILQLVDDRRFRLLGRANDLVHVAGKRTSLGHLNHQLNSIPGVADGAFWLPDDVADGVVRPVAFVVAPELDAAALRAALRERLEAVFVPRRIVHVDALPREATGKLTVAALRAFALERLGGAA